MRPRHKKNLESRLDAASEYLLTLRNESKNFNDAASEKHLLDIEEIFGNRNPVHLEIGGGKGTFSCVLAERNPDINVLCVEKVRDVIVVGCETAKEMGLTNVKFLDCAAEYLPSYIEEHSVEAIYLNFSCPYPKKRYASHRLTSKRFLDIYKKLLTNGAPIIQKTDNRHFFEYSLESFSQNGFELSGISLDLHTEEPEDNIVTEYEEKFSSQGFPIYRLEARIKTTP